MKIHKNVRLREGCLLSPKGLVKNKAIALLHPRLRSTGFIAISISTRALGTTAAYVRSVAESLMIKIKDLFKAYYDCRKNKRKTKNALLFELNLEENLVDLWNDINNRTYQIGKSVTFVVYKPKKREIFAATFRDRIVHHLVINKLNYLFENHFIEDTYNCRKNKGVLYGVKRLQEKIRIASNNYTEDCYIGRFDMQGFFNSIHKLTLWKMLEKFINAKYFGNDKSEILYLVKLIVLHNPAKNCIRKCPISCWNDLPKEKSLFTCGEECGLPIGNLTSQVFANFYLSYFDKTVSSKFLYGRYVDDFYIIGKSTKEITSAIPYFRKILDKLNCKLHPSKWEIQHFSKGVIFTGSIIKFDRRYTKNSTINSIKQKIIEFNNIEKKSLFIDNVISSLNSYLGFLVHNNNFGKRVEIIKLLDSDWFKYLKPSEDFKKLQTIKRNMIVKFNKKEKYVPIKNVKGKYVIAFDFEEDVLDTESGTWKEVIFDYKPSLQKIKDTIFDWIDIDTKNKIVNEFKWNEWFVKLTIEDQANYSREYYIATTLGSNFPITVKANEDGVIKYLNFSNLEEYEKFYLAMDQHIKDIQKRGWEKKNNVNLENYKI